MVWLYWTGFAMLVGAELNAELAKRTKEGAIEQKEDPHINEAHCVTLTQLKYWARRQFLDKQGFRVRVKFGIQDAEW